jgi:hypothetical protein
MMVVLCLPVGISLLFARILWSGTRVRLNFTLLTANCLFLGRIFGDFWDFGILGILENIPAGDTLLPLPFKGRLGASMWIRLGAQMWR